MWMAFILHPPACPLPALTSSSYRRPSVFMSVLWDPLSSPQVFTWPSRSWCTLRHSIIRLLRLAPDLALPVLGSAEIVQWVRVLQVYGPEFGSSEPTESWTWCVSLILVQHNRMWGGSKRILGSSQASQPGIWQKRLTDRRPPYPPSPKRKGEELFTLG